MLAVVPPFGKETITVYAATQPLGDVAKTEQGPIYQLKGNRDNIAIRTRGIQLKPKMPEVDTSDAVEFYETSLTINTRPGP